MLSGTNLIGKYVISPIDGKEYCRKNGSFARHIADNGYTYQTLIDTFYPSEITYCSCGNLCKFEQKSMQYKRTCGAKECASKLTSAKRLERTPAEWATWKANHTAIMSAKTVDEKDKIRDKRLSTGRARGSYVNSVAKRESTCHERYGAKNVSNLLINNDARLKLENYDWMYSAHIVDQKPLYVIAAEIDVGDRTVGKYLHGHGIQTNHFANTMWEREVAEVLTESGVEFIQNDKTVLNGQHLDFYVPSKNIAIELCGLYWHSSSQPRMTTVYHKNKMVKCSEQGIKLFTVFEDEWIYSKHVVLSTIRNAVGVRLSPSVYARTLSIDTTVSVEERRTFLNEHHIQGDGKGSYCFGLRDGSSLKAVLLASRTGNTINIVRYAALNVVGGFSRLLKVLTAINEWDEIVTFADLRWSQGELYQTTGFELVYTIPPDYQYIVGNRREHKFNFRHAALSRKLKTYNPALSEWDNCQANNISRIWDCGKLKYRLMKGHAL